MPKYVFDTNIFISRLADRLEVYKTLYVSTVVLNERMTASNDLGDFRSYLSIWQKAQKDKVLLVPNPEDWLTASRIAYALAQERKQQAGGQAPKQSAKVKQEIAFDCLLAASAAREGVTVITLDSNDFRAIRRHCKNLDLMIVKL